ncbi:MAG: hypothetical protein IKR36_01290, partial [Clostridia bacterium]|nr:hypothetical protein [Clostridia bacterium]
MSGHHGIWAKNSAVYEDVLQIPLIIHLPGQTQGIEHPEYASNLDLLPTTMRQAFGEALECDGRDCTDQASAPQDIISEKDNQVAIIHNNRKLVLTRFKGTMYRELYDLSKDPDEFENVYSKPEYQADIEEMTALLDKDPDRMPRVFYDGSGYPYWMVPPQPGIPLRPKEEV